MCFEAIENISKSEEVLIPSRTFVETNMITAAATYWYVL